VPHPLTFWPLPIQSTPQTTQTVHVHSVDAPVPPEGLEEAFNARGTTTTPAALFDAVGASTTTPAALRIPNSTLTLAVVIPLVALLIPLVAWAVYKTILVRRRAASLAAPTPVSPTPLIASIRVVAVTEVPVRFEEDETMRKVHDFWSPISPGPPELHVEYKNLEVAIGSAVNPATTHLPLLARDASGFFCDLDYTPATPRAGGPEYTLRSPSVDRDTSPASPEVEHTDEAAYQDRASTVAVVDEGGICSSPSTPKSVRTMCTLTSISSSLSLHPFETPTKAIRRQVMTLEPVPVIKVIEATPERSERKPQGYTQRFNSRAITPRQARLQNLI